MTSSSGNRNDVTGTAQPAARDQQQRAQGEGRRHHGQQDRSGAVGEKRAPVDEAGHETEEQRFHRAGPVPCRQHGREPEHHHHRRVEGGRDQHRGQHAAGLRLRAAGALARQHPVRQRAAVERAWSRPAAARGRRGRPGPSASWARRLPRNPENRMSSPSGPPRAAARLAAMKPTEKGGTSTDATAMPTYGSSDTTDSSTASR